MQGSNCTIGKELTAKACSTFVCALDAIFPIQKHRSMSNKQLSHFIFALVASVSESAGHGLN